LALVEKELQWERKDNQALVRYINARRKKKEAQRKEKAWRKAMVVTQRSDEGQSSKDVCTWRK
jgi:hypothetical protein